MSRSAQDGLTLVELVIVLALLAVVLAVSIPSFARLRCNIQLRSDAHRLLSAIQMARAEAVQRVRAVRLCPSARGEGCEGVYRDGWLLFVDTGGNGLFDPESDEVLLRGHGLPGGYRVTDSGGSNPAVGGIAYRPDGSTSRNRTLMLCAPTARRVAPYSIVISLPGRARLARGEGQCAG